MRITNLCLILGIAISLLACQTTEQNPPKPTETQVVMVGNDRDKHGCKASAGYIWSELKGECVRIWEVGSKLVYTPANDTQEITTFVVYSTDSTQLETFGTNKQLWTRTENSTSWTSADKQQSLEQTAQGWILK